MRKTIAIATMLAATTSFSHAAHEPYPVGKPRDRVDLPRTSAGTYMDANGVETLSHKNAKRRAAGKLR